MAKLPGAIAGARIVGEKFVHAQRQQNPEGRMPLMDHIRELRNRVVKIALALGAGMIVGFVFFTPIWKVIDRPLCHAVIRGHTGCNTLGVNQRPEGRRFPGVVGGFSGGARGVGRRGRGEGGSLGPPLRGRRWWWAVPGDPARRRELDPGRSVHELRDGHAAGLRAGL